MPVLTPTNPKKFVITGWILSAIPALMLLSGAVNGFRMAPMVVDGMVHTGYPVSVVPVIATLELVCALLFLIPRTAFYGAVLMTAYFGGAVATHIRIGESLWFVAVVFGLVTWIALACRDVRLRAYLLGQG